MLAEAHHSPQHRTDVTVPNLLKWRALPAFALLTLAGACAPTAHIARPDAALPREFEKMPAPEEGGAVQLDHWWSDFHDAQLTALIETALNRSTTSRMAYARLSEARAVRGQTRAGTLPSGTLSGTATESGTEALWGAGATTPGQQSYQASFSPSWEVDLFGRLAAIRDSASAQYQASVYDFQGTRLALAADVAASLFQARATAADLETARLSLDVSSRLAETARLGEAHGLTSGQDTARLDANVASARAEVVRLEGELRALKRSLLILAGTPDAATDSLPIAAELELPPPLPSVTPGLLLARRPDVLSAERSLRVAVLGARVDRLALFPRLNIQAGVGLSAVGNTVGLSAAGGTGLWSIASGLALPILDRARLLAQFHVSEARGQEAVVSYERAVQQAFGEAENALTRLAASQERLVDLERAEERSHTAYQIAERGYRAGLTDLTTLLQTQSTWLQTRTARNAGRLALLNGTVTAIRALGGGWEPEAGLEPPVSKEPISDGTHP